jgi:hypothetical protein
MKRLQLLKLVFFVLWMGACSLPGNCFTRLTPSAKFSVLTCSPGPDLYSLFGHSAFRLQDTLGGKPLDVVFNYGVFDAFDDGFYVKFARGKLDYRLQAEYYEYFIESYAQEGRGVWEQELNFNPMQKQRLFDLLQSNVQEPNCVYRYDFFFDNCSSRIRDMIIRAAADAPTEGMGFRYISLDTLLSVNKVGFNHPCKHGTTYREAIQKYLDFQPWSDFGIDIALGQPCDRIIGDYGFMFLPDSLMRELELAELDGHLLCSNPTEILPNKTKFVVHCITAPLSLLLIWLVIHASISYRYRRSERKLLAHEGILLSITGFISLLVIFLWFMTDHTTTQNNWNLLWASPLNLLLLFFARKRQTVRIFSLVQLAACSCMLIAFPWLPQSLHVATLPIVLMLIITYYRLHRNTRIIEH